MSVGYKIEVIRKNPKPDKEGLETFLKYTLQFTNGFAIESGVMKETNTYDRECEATTLFGALSGDYYCASADMYCIDTEDNPEYQPHPYKIYRNEKLMAEYDLWEYEKTQKEEDDRDDN